MFPDLKNKPKPSKDIVSGLLFLACIFAVGAYFLIKHVYDASQQNYVLSIIARPSACDVLQKNDMLAWLVGPDNINPAYQVAFGKSASSKSGSTCDVYLKQGASLYQGVFTLSYNYYLSKENIGTPYNEDNNPAYFTELQKNFYTANVIVEPMQQSGNYSKELSGIVAAAADVGLPNNSGIKPAN